MVLVVPTTRLPMMSPQRMRSGWAYRPPCAACKSTRVRVLDTLPIWDAYPQYAPDPRPEKIYVLCNVCCQGGMR